MVKIHGRSYMTVAERINLLHNSFDNVEVVNELCSECDASVTMKSTVSIDGRRFTGYAREYFSTKKNQVNYASALENCETSAVGRALAFAGFGGSEIASANEMSRVDDKKQNKSEQVSVREALLLDLRLSRDKAGVAVEDIQKIASAISDSDKLLSPSEIAKLPIGTLEKVVDKIKSSDKAKKTEKKAKLT